MAAVEWDDVQGLVRNSFPKLGYAAYVLWRLTSPGSPQAQQWMRRLSQRLISAGTREGLIEPDGLPHGVAMPRSVGALDKLRDVERWAINLALTPSGLKGLGVDVDELGRFSSEFQAGMAPCPEPGEEDARRSCLLGDTGANSPKEWHWGGRGENRHFDGMLLLYASNRASLHRLVAYEIAAMGNAAVALLGPGGGPLLPEGRAYHDSKGHLRFADGISQPVMKGSPEADQLDAKQGRISLLEPGELVLGYPDERYATVSYADPPDDPRDLARNGTYLVFRQLALDVKGFEDFTSCTAQRLGQSEEWVAARLIGRHRNGEPLVPAAADNGQDPRKRNDFLYVADDPYGLGCPLGAHIRRANPRDIVGPDQETALRLSRMHRIMRRGRTYGRRHDHPDPDAGPVTEERGLHFICLNASIAGQFELIQHSWLNNTHFAGLADEADPMSHTEAGCVMTIQSRPTNLHLPLDRFASVRGGAYFFLPGIRALQDLIGGRKGQRGSAGNRHARPCKIASH